MVPVALLTRPSWLLLSVRLLRILMVDLPLDVSSGFTDPQLLRRDVIRILVSGGAMISGVLIRSTSTCLVEFSISLLAAATDWSLLESAALLVGPGVPPIGPEYASLSVTESSTVPEVKLQFALQARLARLRWVKLVTESCDDRICSSLSPIENGSSCRCRRYASTSLSMFRKRKL